MTRPFSPSPDFLPEDGAEPGVRLSADNPCSTQEVLSDLARVKVLFQARTIATVMGLPDHGTASDEGHGA